ncbi:hypothetical protein [Halostreptopolyspora alba]|uniref:hypothetical protein n=1 Tax=Halostreptopolyspora alba TaxID=2487137 RepID=UPI00370FCBD4
MFSLLGRPSRHEPRIGELTAALGELDEASHEHSHDPLQHCIATLDVTPEDQ